MLLLLLPDMLVLDTPEPSMEDTEVDTTEREKLRLNQRLMLMLSMEPMEDMVLATPDPLSPVMAAPAVASYAAPVISRPAVASYAAPVISRPAIAAPAVASYAAPAIATTAIAAPAVASYAAPAIA